jgi:SAM-dependent methyltransferase
MNTGSLAKDKSFYGSFAQYAENFKPFSWDSYQNDFRPAFRGKNELIISFYRYYKVMCEIRNIRLNERSCVVDYGVYPGVIPKLFRDFFPEHNIKYYGIGLGFTQPFVESMEKIGIKLIETELDPFYIKPKQVVPIDCRDADLVLFLDIIEHLASPIYALDSANRSLKKGGLLILTTDNITSKEHFLPMLMGKTPLLHPILTNMFFVGDWRPHFREYSKDDLIWLLKHCGFEIMKHEYFDRRQGEYRVINGCLTREKSFVAKSYYGQGIFKKIKWYVLRTGVAVLRTLLDPFPHFRNHQMIVARKVKDIAELDGQRPELQSTLEGWKSIREKYLGY